MHKMHKMQSSCNVPQKLHDLVLNARAEIAPPVASVETADIVQRLVHDGAHQFRVSHVKLIRDVDVLIVALPPHALKKVVEFAPPHTRDSLIHVDFDALALVVLCEAE